MAPAVALTIAGSDSSGAAGLQADIATFAALGVHGLCAVTAITAQNSGGVQWVEPVDADLVGAQIDAATADGVPDAAKTGLLWTAEMVDEVAGRRAIIGESLVVDPVLVDSNGDRFVEAAVIDAYRRRLFPLATATTPNLAEAAALIETPLTSIDDVIGEAARLGALAPVVVVTGGRLGGVAAVDVVIAGGTTTLHERPRITTANVRGSGCTFSAALAAHLALGVAPTDAAKAAGDFAHAAVVAGASWRLGSGRGPVAHASDPAVRSSRAPG